MIAWESRPPHRLLESVAPKPLPLPRSVASIGAELRTLHGAGALDLPADLAGRWAALAAFGRTDLTLARLAEGHTDAVAILREAGRAAVPGALYGVWAAKSGGTGATLDGGRLGGTIRFCSGLSLLDRALVVAGDRLLELDLADAGVRRRPDAWQAVGMDASDSGDVDFAAIPVPVEALIGPPGWYVERPGFALGGAGVAAVWLGGAAGVVDDVLAYLRAGHGDEHQLAHLGAMHTALRSAEALLFTASATIAAAPDPWHVASTCRAAAEHAVGEILEHAPRLTGASPLGRDRRFAQRLADLGVYVRQHHAERDLAALGRQVLDSGEHA
ncbi:acyl-CoA dehydrogenase family protein [Amycolatopsis rhabdoformis]|uniref:Acyl-CoA dehydrogenase family protein n=1 Tax=Amycolatopsis rhabdoformis TaxID=1448059 RepID=A0ABZ1ILB2_9PSEU|nr:acyl-CoA dehydrogenase family protein [Amycolatopsis rhabdoformis]WSE34661.1 acyl-CoA dehydrogenase family protein [Amycolatopsis rhabdoformis]